MVMVLIAIAIIIFTAGCSPQKQEVPAAVKNLERFRTATIEHPSKPAPSFELKDDKGQKLNNDVLKGKVYILQGFAPGCSSCAREIATLNKMYSAYGDKGLDIISLDVASEEISGAIETKRKFNGGDWHWTIDTDNVAVKFEINSLESTYIVDKEGIIRYKDESISDADTLAKEIEKLI